MSMTEGMFDGLRAELEATQADLSAAREEVETWKWRHEQDTARLETALLAARRDATRLNWLETKVVNVREPLRYGSLDLLWASPENEDADTAYAPSDIRKQIDAALAATPEGK